MKRYRWPNKRLTSRFLLGIILVVATSLSLGIGTMVAAYTPPETEWDKTFGGSSYDFAESIEQTTDGGYIIAGTTESLGAGAYDIYLVKTDASGNATWAKTFGGSYYDYGRSAKQTSDDGYIVTGAIVINGLGWEDVYLLKTDDLGNKTWEKTFGGSTTDHAYDVEQTADGGYIIVGETDCSGAGLYDIYLIKTDASGNLTWEKTFGGSDYDYGRSVQQTTDEGYIIVGATTDIVTGEDIYLIKTDSSGNVTWEKTYGGSSYDFAYNVAQTTDGGYIIVGETESFGAGLLDFYVIKTDSSGNVTWEKTYGDTGYDFASSIKQTADGGYIVAGTTDSYGAGYEDVYLIKTDASGNVIWDKTHGGIDSEYAYSVQQTTDGGYIVVGETYSYGASSGDIYLVKVIQRANTPVGQDVSVNLDSGNLTFSEVTANGTTTITTLTENPVDPTPADFYVIAGNFFEISTTASYSSPITVGIRYDEALVDNEESLRLFHWNGSEWEDATTYVDTVENMVYGQVDSLSPFFIGEPIEPTVPPVANAGGPYLVQLNHSISLNGSASYHPDPNRIIVSYNWTFGDNTIGSGESVNHTYTAVGVYNVTLTVTDDRAAQSSDTTMVVVYDPTKSFATGGGWFWSDKGNLIEYPESEGKATFGFVVKYKQDVASGNLEFQYHAGDINLKSTEIDWLVISSNIAQFQGTGTINGDGLYTFRVQAKDGNEENGQLDELTIRIWEGIDTEGDPIYQAINAQLDGGNIIVHKK